MSVRLKMQTGRMDDTRKVLKRLNQKVGREAARYERMCANATSPVSKERAWGEAAVLRQAQGFIRDELRKVKKR